MHLLRCLQLGAVLLIHRVSELAEGVGHLPTLNEHLEPLRVAGLGAMRLRDERAHLRARGENEKPQVQATSMATQRPTNDGATLRMRAINQAGVETMPNTNSNNNNTCRKTGTAIRKRTQPGETRKSTPLWKARGATGVRNQLFAI